MSVLNLHVVVSPMQTLPDGKSTFSPTTATLTYGETEAVLVDTLLRTSDVQALGDRVAASGRRLTATCATHAHADHYVGAEALLARFPTARAVAAPEVADAIRASAEADAAFLGPMFPELATAHEQLPWPLDDRTIDVDSEELRVLPPGRGDVSPTAAVHVPSLGAGIAGDVVCNRVHAMLAFGGPPEWQAWVEHVDRIEALSPRLVVAGHKQPDASDDAVPQLAATCQYVLDFADAVAVNETRRRIVEAMLTKYPDYGNLTTLVVSAGAAVQGR